VADVHLTEIHCASAIKFEIRQVFRYKYLSRML